MEEDLVMSALRQQIAFHRQEDCLITVSRSVAASPFVIAVDAAIRLAALLLKKEDPTYLLSRLVPRDMSEDEAKKVLLLRSKVQPAHEEIECASIACKLSRLSSGDDSLLQSSTDTDNIMKLPDVLLENVLRFLNTKERISSSAVSRKWHKLAHQCTDIVHFNGDELGSKGFNKPLLFGARDFCFIQKVSISMKNFLDPTALYENSETNGLLLDNFFRSVPKLKGVRLDFNDCSTSLVQGLMRGSGGLGALTRNDTLE
jgi:hypothetical protein